MAMLRTRRLAIGKIGTLARPAPLAIPVNRKIYTCPPDNRAIVRDIRLYARRVLTGTLTATTYFYIDHSGEPEVIIWGVKHREGSPPAWDLVCDVVLEPGDVLGVFTSLGDIDYTVSGAELPLIPAR